MSERPQGSVCYDNKGRVVIVTGGAGGIGAAICEGFARSGATVISVDVKPWEHGPPANVIEWECDTAREAECKSLVEKVVDQYGAIDVLVNNAAIQPRESYHPIHELSADTWDRMININLGGYHYMAKSVIPLMLKQHSGVILNMASGQAHRTAREVGVYGPIKAANLMQTRQWGVEYARDGIRVVSVSPGAIDTPMVRASLEAQGGEAALANRHPLGRIGQPHEIAQAVLWLTSADASFITATDLEVDGGLGAFGAFADPYTM